MTIWKILKWKYYSTVLNTSWARFCQWTTGFYIFHLLYLMTLPFFLISGFVTNWCYDTFIKYLRPLMFNIPRAEFLVLPYFPVSENGSVMSLVVRLHHAFLFISQFNSSTAFRFSKCRKKIILSCLQDDLWFLTQFHSPLCTNLDQNNFWFDIFSLFNPFSIEEIFDDRKKINRNKINLPIKSFWNFRCNYIKCHIFPDLHPC